ncbi:PcfJ domain-containing protein [Anaerostipes sp.]|uniref:PcfJ domain-containing protein n=1 Tax=Anaerostipes sp. TaxID=1872530 RepID=UPI002E77C4C1|nr:PcfJ domain-containing protein [Anaerostipes sp.]MED9814718.1 PcfJ domain-containing protein [Anaerostipes sp.]
MKKKAIEKISFGKKKIHKLGDCFMIDGKWIDGKTNNINARICLREHEFANYIEGIGWNTKCLESWWKYSDDQFKVELELSKKEKKELSDFYKQNRKNDWRWREQEPNGQINEIEEKINSEKREKRYEKRMQKIKEESEEIRPITKGLKQWAEKQMESYLFYKESTGFCGKCGQEVKLDRRKQKITHNKRGICPSCRKRITYKAAGRQSHIEDSIKVVRFQKTNLGIAAIESLVVKKSFAENKESVRIADRFIWFIEENYKLFNELAENPNEEAYWYDTGAMNTGKARIYPKNLKQIIKGTWLSHSGIDVVASWKGKQEQYEMIIENYMQNPQLELVIKANMRKLTRQLWSYDRFLNKGTKLNEVLGLTKANMRKARDYDLGRDEIRVLRNDPDGKLSNDEVIALANAGCHYLAALRTFTTIRKIANYTQKGHDAGIWVDYLKMAKDLGYNMKDKAVLFPRKLKVKHDDLAKIMKIQGDNIREKKYQQRIPELKALYSYETSKYKIIVPESLKAIVDEGQNLHHCVGTYTEKVAEGETDILFIRKQGEEETSYYTMEVKNLEIIQYRGAYNNLHNNPVPKEIDQFVKQFHNALIKRARKAA